MTCQLSRLSTNAMVHGSACHKQKATFSTFDTAPASPHSTTAAMATRSPEGLQALLKKVGVDGAVPQYAFADVRNSPMDLYRAYLAETLARLTACGPQVAYDSIQWPGDQADLMVVLPRLRLPNTDWNELAGQLMQQVCCYLRSSIT
jgi:hypothetical protein